MNKSSPWFLVTVGILGLIVGYSFVIGKSGVASAANGYSCPMKDMQVCKGMDCDKNPACASGLCTATCPGNCNHHA